MTWGLLKTLWVVCRLARKRKKRGIHFDGSLFDSQEREMTIILRFRSEEPVKLQPFPRPFQLSK
jgi:hypothetical protein